MVIFIILVLKGEYIMKFVKIKKEDDFVSAVAIATTKFEKDALQHLKYDLLDKEYVCGNWHPEECKVCHPLDLVDVLGYPNASHDKGKIVDDNNMVINWVPTNLDAIIAGYRLAGKYRKVARILKECKRLKIDAPFLCGYQIPNYYLDDDEYDDIE